MVLTQSTDKRNAAGYAQLLKWRVEADKITAKADALERHLFEQAVRDLTLENLMRGARLRAARLCNQEVKGDSSLNVVDRAVYAYATLRRKEWRRPSRFGRRDTAEGFFIDVDDLRVRLSHKRFKRANGDCRPSEGLVYRSLAKLESKGGVDDGPRYLQRGRESGKGRKHRGRTLFWLPKLTDEEERQFEEQVNSV